MQSITHTEACARQIAEQRLPDSRIAGHPPGTGKTGSDLRGNIGSVQHQERRCSCLVKGAARDERTLTRREEAELTASHCEGGR